MKLFLWSKPAFIPGSPVDHTWVTSYDSRYKSYKDIQSVINGNEYFWFCKGDFHKQGNFIGKDKYRSIYAKCLVIPNDKNENGTIFRYAIDGVCHQVSNQVLYRSGVHQHNLIARKARGYKVSSAIYGTYGKKKDEWNQNKLNCNVGSISRSSSVFISRALNHPMFNSLSSFQIINSLDKERISLLLNIEEESLMSLRNNETPQERANNFNRMINFFLNRVANEIPFEIYTYIFGINPSIEINIIDPEYFARDFRI